MWIFSNVGQNHAWHYIRFSCFNSLFFCFRHLSHLRWRHFIHFDYVNGYVSRMYFRRYSSNQQPFYLMFTFLRVNRTESIQVQAFFFIYCHANDLFPYIHPLLNVTSALAPYIYCFFLSQIIDGCQSNNIIILPEILVFYFHWNDAICSGTFVHFSHHFLFLSLHFSRSLESDMYEIFCSPLKMFTCLYISKTMGKIILCGCQWWKQRKCWRNRKTSDVAIDKRNSKTSSCPFPVLVWNESNIIWREPVAN